MASRRATGAAQRSSATVRAASARSTPQRTASSMTSSSVTSSVRRDDATGLALRKQAVEEWPRDTVGESSDAGEKACRQQGPSPTLSRTLRSYTNWIPERSDRNVPTRVPSSQTSRAVSALSMLGTRQPRHQVGRLDRLRIATFTVLFSGQYPRWRTVRISRQDAWMASWLKFRTMPTHEPHGAINSVTIWRISVEILGIWAHFGRF
jgi:hypothetical protein